MKRFLFLLLFFFIPAFLFAETAQSIIKKVDRNQIYRTEKFSATMKIIKGKRILTKKFNGYGQKQGKKSFMRYTNPEDRNVKYLKLNKDLWIYFPDADDIMKISGHMLKKGMMGSDISYEDLLETEEMNKKYSSKLIGEKRIDGVICYVIELNAIVKNTSYAKQILYIDKKNFVSIKIEMYAKGGRLLKVMKQSNFKNISGHYIAQKTEIIDKRKKNSKTILTFQNIRFNVVLPRGIFSRRNLRR